MIKSDFDQYDWQSLIAQSERKEWMAYSHLFLKKVDEAVALGDDKMLRIFSELQCLASTPLPIDASEPNFFPSPPSEELIQAFTDMVLEIVDCDMRALIADAVQSYKRNHIMAQIAVDAYVESAIRLQDLMNWLSCASRLRRAVSIAAQYGSKKKQNPSLEKVLEHIEKNILETYQGDDPRFLTETALHLLLKYRKELQGDAYARYAAYAGKAALRAEADHDWHRARRYWQLQTDCYQQCGDEDNKRIALATMVETYVSASSDALTGSSPHVNAASCIHSAIQAYHNIGGFQQRVQELQILLDEYQQKSLSEYKPMGFVMDMSSFTMKAQSQVQGKTWQEALDALVSLDVIPSKAEIRKLLEEIARKAPLSFLLPVELVRERGKVFETIPSSRIGSQAAANATTTSDMREHIEARKLHELLALSCIEPARKQIVQEHAVTQDDISSLIANSSFVPSDRMRLYTKGLWYGLQGDYMIATHLLIPQIEESLRHVLHQKGILSSNFKQGIQDERPLGETLYIFETKAADVFDPDLLFTIKGLLQERSGSNMRNDLGHGLLNDVAFVSGKAIYAWWLALKLCLLPQFQQKKDD